MRVSFLRFGFVVSLLALVRVVFAYLATQQGEIAPLSSSLTLLTNSESLLATGRKLPLGCADVASLELVNGISDRLALELIDSYPRIKRAVEDGMTEEQALQLAHGVGETSAKKLAHFISIAEPCTADARYEMFELSDNSALEVP